MDVIFNFQKLMATVQSGLSGNMIPAIQNVSYVLMAICLLIGVYEAFAQGGNTRQLAAAVFKYVVVAFIVGNWARFFTDLTNGFSAIAKTIDNSYGGWDMMLSWGNQLTQSFNNGGYGSIWNIITNGGAAIFNALEVALAYLLFPFAVEVFTLIYIFWGAVVYAVGPLVLALAPSRMVNSTAKFYAQNLVVWNCWPIVYAILACLISAVNGQDINASPFFQDALQGVQTQVLIGLTSILYALCILLIPVIAFFVLKAEFPPVGGAMIGLAATANQAQRLLSGAGRASGGGGRGSLAAQGGEGVGSYASAFSKPGGPPAATPPRET